MAGRLLDPPNHISPTYIPFLAVLLFLLDHTNRLGLDIIVVPAERHPSYFCSVKLTSFTDQTRPVQLLRNQLLQHYKSS